MTVSHESTVRVNIVLDRRRVLQLGGGLILSVACGGAIARAGGARPNALSNTQSLLDAGKNIEGFAPNAFVRITRADEIYLILPCVEFGQGIYTAQAMMIAEELEVDLDQVQLLDAPPDNVAYINPELGFQGTGGSTGIRGFWKPLRTAGAAARTLLVQAAADRWKVSPGECVAQRGAVLHLNSGRRTRYGELVEVAARLPKPADVVLKRPDQFRLLGKVSKRVDAAAKVNGTAKFGIDMMLPGMKFATVRACPYRAGNVAAVDDAAAKQIAGVIQVIRLPQAVAVVAEHYWAAKMGLDALSVRWNPGPNETLSSAALWAGLQGAASKGQRSVAVSRGDAPRALAKSTKRLEAEFRQPLMAHAPMEPAAAVVHVHDGLVEIWGGTQIPIRVQAEVARLVGIAPKSVLLHTLLIGGSFGRKLESDVMVQAVEIARECPFPVKVVWSREEDIQRDNFRPMYIDHIRAALDENGLPAAWHHCVTADSVMTRFSPEWMRSNGVDPDAVEEAEETVYGQFRNMLVEYVRHPMPEGIIISWMRGVGALHNLFVVESFIDELAKAAGADPVAYRRRLLANVPRALAVLDRAAKESNWGSPLPSRCGRGVMVTNWLNTYIALVVEVAVSNDGDVALQRITAVVDCGSVVNPNLVRQQMEGGVLFGLSNALHAQITFAHGKVEQSNFHDYRVLRMNEIPPIAVHIVTSTDTPGGLGECSCAAAAPALRNAIYSATGVAVRELPIPRDLLKKSGTA